MLKRERRRKAIARQPYQTFAKEYADAVQTAETGYRLMTSRWWIVRVIGEWFVDCGERNKAKLSVEELLS